MKNSECTIFIMTEHGWIQKFRKEEKRWILTSRKGTIYTCTAEQLLSHILPPLAGIKGQDVTVKVVPDKGTEV